MLNRNTIAALIIVAIFLGTLAIYAWPSEQFELSFETISRGYNSGYENHTYLVIQSSEEWRRIRSLAWPERSDIPDVDFSRYLVIAAFMGLQPTGGHEITIKGIVEGNEIIVGVEEIYPGRIYVTEALTLPYHIVALERSQKPISFEVQQFLAHAHDADWKPYDKVVYEPLGKQRVEVGGGPTEP